MQVVNTLNNLEHDALCAFFRQHVVPLCDVVEEIFACHVLKHDVVALTRLKKINQLDYVLMLAHLQHFNLSPLLVDLNGLHVGLGDLLDGNLVL